MMGAVTAWPLAMQSSLAPLQSRTNFRSYVAPGGEHCISTSDRFYSEASTACASATGSPRWSPGSLSITSSVRNARGEVDVKSGTWKPLIIPFNVFPTVQR